MFKRYYVYIMTNARHSILYVGVTNDLSRRVTEHKCGRNEGFTKRYKAHELVYFEECGDINDAIAREKQIKSWRRDKKDALIVSLNPQWRDLSQES